MYFRVWERCGKWHNDWEREPWGSDYDFVDRGLILQKKNCHLHMLCNPLPCTVATEIRVRNLTSWGTSPTQNFTKSVKWELSCSDDRRADRREEVNICFSQLHECAWKWLLGRKVRQGSEPKLTFGNQTRVLGMVPPRWLTSVTK